MRSDGGHDPLRLACLLGLLGLLVFLGAAAPPGKTSIEECMARQTAQLQGRSPEQAGIGNLEGVCFTILSDEQKIAHGQITNRIYATQITHSHVLLVTVVVITLSGLVLATLQLWASYKLAVASHGTLADGGDVTIEPGKVAVKSSVVGVIILAISLAFFGLFVTKVYPIQQVIAGKSTDTAAGTRMPAPGRDAAPGNAADVGLVGPEAK
jgi:hypothetical protein